MADFRDRIRAGDLAALADPALPLHLLADGPTAEWWREGCEPCARTLNRTLAEDCVKRATLALFRLIQSPGWAQTTHLERCRRLRALLPSAPPELDAALEVLERYSLR